MLRFTFTLLSILFLWACSSRMVPASHVKFLSAEDEAVLELLSALKKNPADKSLIDLLEPTYHRAMESRIAMQGFVLRDNPAGDRWVYWRKQLEASQSITDAVLAFPQASSIIKNPVYFRDQISDARQQAAAEYYDQAVGLLESGNRQEAKTAIDFLRKANREVDGYRDYANQVRRAEEMATLLVVVNPVDYYSFGWNYWGLQNDYLQWQIVRDLNSRSYQYTKFITQDEARGRNVQPERIVDMRFGRLEVYNPYTERNTISREKTIAKEGGTAGQTVVIKATLTVTRRFINGDADLECRIYDVPTGRNILYDHFPGRYNWVFESATYAGDRRALTDDDFRLINNHFDRYPTREEVGRKLIDEAYGALLRRIQQGVNFDTY